MKKAASSQKEPIEHLKATNKGSVKGTKVNVVSKSTILGNKLGWRGNRSAAALRKKTKMYRGKVSTNRTHVSGFSGSIDRVFDIIGSKAPISTIKDLEKLTTGFLGKQKDVLQMIKKSDDPDNLVYFIVLKEDTLSNRAPLLKFIEKYRQSSSFDKFGLFFEFIPMQLATELHNFKEIVVR